jgi:hypothetical protein
VSDSSDKEWISKWWDDLFEKYGNQKNIRKNSPKILISIRMWSFIIGNRLYWKKIKKIIKI